MATQDGDKLIAEVEVGDLVMGYSEVAGAVSFMHITATHNELHETTLDVTIDGEVVHTTDEHPFFVLKDGEGEWVKAKDLQVGDVIFNTMGKDGIVEAVEVVDESQTMYNLSVQLVASYFVGDGQWLVHNVDIIIPNLPEVLQPGLGLLQRFAPKEFQLYADGLLQVTPFDMNMRMPNVAGKISGTNVTIYYGEGVENLGGAVADTLYHEGVHAHQPSGIRQFRAELQAWGRSYKFSSNRPEIWNTIGSQVTEYNDFLSSPESYISGKVRGERYKSPHVGALYEKGKLYGDDGLFLCGR